MDDTLRLLVSKLQQLDEEIISKQNLLKEIEIKTENSSQLLKTFQQKVDKLAETEKILNFEIKEGETKVKERESNLHSMLEKRKNEISKLSEEIVLNIGGKLFFTSKSTLTSQENLFYFLFSSGKFKPNEKNEYFFDRDPEYFDIILNYLRSGREINWSLIKSEEDFVTELDYYQIQFNEIDLEDIEKVEKIQKKMEKKREAKNLNFKTKQEMKNSKFPIALKCGKKISYSNGIVKKIGTGVGDDSGILFESAKKWMIKIISNAYSGLMIGVAGNSFDADFSQHSNCGFYIHTGNCCKYAQNGTINQYYAGNVKCNNDGDTIIVEYSYGNLKYCINGTDHGIAYSNLPKNLYPAVCYIFNPCCEFEFTILEISDESEPSESDVGLF
jgi:hypothetical protein